MSKIMNWIRDNSPVSFDCSTGKLRAFTAMGGRAVEIPIPERFQLQENDPSVQYAQKLLEGGPIPVKQFNDGMRMAGFSRKQIQMAKDYLDLKSNPEGFRSKWNIYYRSDP